MYQLHWGLEQSPFCTVHDERFFYENPTHNEALARLHYLVENRRRVGLLAGPRGSGKSLLLDVFARQLKRQGHEAACASALGAGQRELLWSLAAELGLNPRIDADTFTLWRALADGVAALRHQRRTVVLLVDDIDRAGDGVKLLCLRLSQIEPSADARLTLVMTAADPRRAGRSLLGLCDLRIDVEPWDVDDTAGFLHASTTRAGRAEAVFDLPASRRLHDLTHGIPRQVTQLAELALAAGAGKGLECVDEATVDSAYRELFAGA
jgi:type II secretory pathway predicted ATPase ExeA